jgi:hypothetical protein
VEKLSLNKVSALGTIYVEREYIRWLLHPQFLFNCEELKTNFGPAGERKAS